MNPNNGEIYAMVNAPEFNLNEPYKLNYETNEKLSQKKKQDLLNRMWRNQCINDTYEPGSTFKVVTATAALENKLVTLDTRFNCPGFRVVDDRRIRCHKTTGHGSETFLQGTMNSCNPVFIDVGLKVGAQKFYAQMKKLGLMQKTGIDIPGEASTIIHKIKNVGPVELATMSFGQSFQITPVQYLVAASAVVNGGKLITPHFAVASKDSKGNLIEKFSHKETENVVSGETFSNVENLKLDIGASEVRIKTGTDDKIHVDDSGMKTENAVQKTLSHDGKTLEITTKMRSSFSFKNVRNAKGTLVIYLPRDYKFDQVDMEYGAVTAEIDGLNAKSLKIESGASGCTIKNADIEELDVETGAGSLDFYGTVEKEVDIDCGAGSVTLNLEGKVEDYNYELDSSAGSIEIGEDIDLGGLSTEKSIDNGSKRTIEISNGAGSVEIRFH